MSKKSSQPQVLIVHDQADVINSLASLFSSRGYAARGAPNGRMALATGRARVPDIICIDSSVVDISCYAICRKFRSFEQTRDVPILMMCSNDDNFDAHEASVAGSTLCCRYAGNDAELVKCLRDCCPIG